VPKVPYAGEHHGESQPIRCLNHFLVSNRPPWLHNRRSADLRRDFWWIYEADSLEQAEPWALTCGSAACCAERLRLSVTLLP
jgi:hypothetical protein